ncbi:hypothetical protein PMIT1342_00023 [Prochlorococcus marinus str. MIT 1342]|uniref:hypothetical protein n=1 Tax=Prochlorococcus TaxID=1218 RepID=UPI0007B38A97|nr:hypothetical protein [Prochlorococcus marinus]KZR84662.1 hypothetical protein PMIT1342_00023 [Prochlorococcus marinus str. MIT 1342]
MTRIAAQILGWEEEYSINFAKFQLESASFFEKNKELEYKIRKENLCDISIALTGSGIRHWLQGKTLLGFTVYRGFIPDHDDDIAIDAKDLKIFCTKTIKSLISQGFRLIRVSNYDSMISMERNKRYIDICIFSYKRNSTFYGYGKYYPSIYYSKACFHSISSECTTPAPEGSLEICNLKYPKLCNYRLNTYVIWEHGLHQLQDINKMLSTSSRNILPVENRITSIKRVDLSDFLEILYCKEKHSSHIYEKCRLLLQIARLSDNNLYSFAVIKFAYKEDTIYPKDPAKLDEKSRKLFNDMKWRVREQFNPRLSGDMQNIKLPNTSPGVSHCHVIHSTDCIAEIVLIDQLVAEYSQANISQKRLKSFI